MAEERSPIPLVLSFLFDPTSMSATLFLLCLFLIASDYPAKRVARLQMLVDHREYPRVVHRCNLRTQLHWLRHNGILVYVCEDACLVHEHRSLLHLTIAAWPAFSFDFDEL